MRKKLVKNFIHICLNEPWNKFNWKKWKNQHNENYNKLKKETEKDKKK